jgi:hypothetical protein
VSAYGHKVQRIGNDHWRLSWIVDFKYPSSRLRFPRVFTRDTDLIGAARFALKHELKPPVEPQ